MRPKIGLLVWRSRSLIGTLVLPMIMAPARRSLAYARLLLTDPRLGHRSIADIAYLVGFGDLSHFNHAFRRRFGATPSKIRAEAQLTKPGGPLT